MMSLTNSQQIQVYESLGQESGNIIHVFEKNTIINIHPVLNNPQPENPDLSISLSFELVIVMLLILTLPILIYVAYRYGKKMGKKEHHSYPSSKSNSPAMKTTLTMSQRSTGENLSESGEAEPEPPVPINNSAEVPRSRSNSNSKQLINKEDGNKLEKSKSSSQTSGSPKSSFETSSDKQEKEFCLDGKANSTIIENEINQANYQLNPCFDEPEKITENFTFLMKKTYDKETNVGNLGQSFDDEKIKLHTDDSQIKKQQIEVKLSFERKDGALQKVETQEIITVYCEDVKEPEKNALMLKKAYENYQNDSAMIDKHFIELNNRGRNRKTTALVSLRTPPVYTNVLNLANQICLPEIENFDPVPESQEASKSSPEPCTLEELLEKDDLPHETGKFNKIFKNAEVIGQGSFGEVYKVVHKLDGKIYAVKKVKLRFGKLEELQQKSKVFREVFAMTDLHHPNIVRYSTCWVEIESGKESALTSTRENDARSEYTRRVVLREVEEVEQSEQSQSSESSQSSNYHTKTSSMGFEWAVEDEKSEKPVSPVNKKKPKNFAQKKESSVFIKSLSKPLNEDCSNLDNSSPASILSNTERAETTSHGYTLHLYIQMEYCAGENLRNFLDSSKRTVVPDKVLKMFKKLLEGVNAIHKRGILHRDLKPANIFLDGDENIKIGDFGLASLDYNEEIRGSSVQMRRSYKGTDRSLSMKIGTPMYSSPEQENGKRYNQKTDIYSLGLILCEMLADLSTHHERYQMFTSLRQSSELPPKFRTKFIRESELILKMTAQCPEERPTAEEIMMEIDRLLQAQASA